MGKLAYIQELVKIRSELLSLLQTIGDRGIELTLLGNGWSVKDLLGHLNWYDNECLLLMQTKNLEGSRLWDLSPKERNSKIKLLYSSITWFELMSEFKKNTPRLISELENLTEEEWENSKMFKNIPFELKPSEIIDSNLNRHYSDHLTQLKAL